MVSRWWSCRESGNVVAMIASNVTDLVREVQPAAASVDQRCPGRHSKVRVENNDDVSSGKILRVRTFLLDTGGSVDSMSPSISAPASEITQFRSEWLVECGWSQPFRD